MGKRSRPVADLFDDNAAGKEEPALFPVGAEVEGAQQRPDPGELPKRQRVLDAHQARGRELAAPGARRRGGRAPAATTPSLASGVSGAQDGRGVPRRTTLKAAAGGRGKAAAGRRGEASAGGQGAGGRGEAAAGGRGEASAGGQGAGGQGAGGRGEAAADARRVLPHQSEVMEFDETPRRPPSVFMDDFCVTAAQPKKYGGPQSKSATEPMSNPQTRQLQVSLFRKLGQQRPLPQGPGLGIQSPNPDFASIGGLRNAFSVKEKQKQEFAAECSQSMDKSALTRLSSADGSNSTESEHGNRLIELKDAEGMPMSKIILADRHSESLGVENLPFVKTCPIWAQIEEMEIEMPRLNLHHLQHLGPELREGMTLGLILSFSIMGENIKQLNIQDDISLFEEKMKGLSTLEANGFDVKHLRSHLETLLHIKNLKEKIAHKETVDQQLGVQIGMLNPVLRQLDLQAYLLRCITQSVVSQKIDCAVEISRLKKEISELAQPLVSRGAFDRTPL